MNENNAQQVTASIQNACRRRNTVISYTLRRYMQKARKTFNRPSVASLIKDLIFLKFIFR